MKRIAVMILALTILVLSVTAVSAGVVESPTAPSEQPKEGELYRDKLKEQYKILWSGELLSYKELYYHKDESGETDWALVRAYSNMEGPLYLYSVVANRVFKQYSYYVPFDTTYGVYDVKQEKFFDVCYISYANYPGFVRVFDELVSKVRYSDDYEVGRLLGDMDGDDELTVIDCTLIQRCDVRLNPWPENDLIDASGEFSYFKPQTYYSDFDRSGERDIVDATKLQRYVTMID